jgi:hypothetical protein
VKVFDVIVENKDLEVSEGPLDYIARAAGSRTAATKIDIKGDAKRLAKDYKAFYKNTPDGVPTTGNLFNFLKKAGLPVGGEKEIEQVLTKLGPRLSQKVGSMISKGAQAIGKKLKGPKSIGGADTLVASMYESIMEAELQPADVERIIHYYVKKGLEVGGPAIKKSKYAAQSKPSSAQAKQQPSQQKTDPQIQKAIDTLKKAGYNVTK